MIEAPKEFASAVRMIPRDKKVPQISWNDDELAKLPSADVVRYLKRLASAMNYAAKLMQDERNDLAGKLRVAELQTAGAEKALSIQKDITRNQLISGNEELQVLSVEIQRLLGEVRARDERIEDLLR